ncbi:hypothetical protein GKC68_10565 [Pantoea sp. RSPAM1]|uniref:hypothetical protein n=1 Tax=Pantoea sp. RSPAM1 TaxID=2675223 RepID=UPI00315DBA9D
MEVDYLLIGHGLDGEIKRDDYPKKNLVIHETVLMSSHQQRAVKPSKFFEVSLINDGGELYAVAIARSTNSSEIVRMIRDSGIRPIPKELLKQSD